ncbi:MAG: translation initiation factor IF-2 [Pseudomonadota bacterium]
MSDTTVRQLAAAMGISGVQLLEKLKAFGMVKQSEEALISEDEKRQLLANLTGRTQAAGGAKKVTLKRRTTSELKQTRTNTGRTNARGLPTHSSKTVSIEVRRRARGKVTKETERERAVRQMQEAQQALADQAAQRETLAQQEKNRRDLIAQRQAEADAVQRAAEAERLAAQQAEEQKAAEEQKIAAERAAAEQKAAAEREKQKQEAEQAATVKPPATETPAPSKSTPEKSKKAPKRQRSAAEEPKRPAGRSTRRQENHAGSEDRGRRGRRKKDTKRRDSSAADAQHAFQKPVEPKKLTIEVPENITVAELAQRLAVKASAVVRTLMGMGLMATINQALDQDTAILVVEEMGHVAQSEQKADAEEQLFTALDAQQQQGEQVARAPVVTIMGHVDHGKTSLLDHIRTTRVAAGEAGGITQHIGAYHVETGHGMITFLDTPGHAAFSAMRARGAKVTDVVILVVAADDGVMPQTREAIQHARAAQVPLIVAINKMDKPEAQPDRVMQELVAEEVVPEDWGGDVQFVQVSAHTGDGIQDLLEAILLQSELLDLMVVATSHARGIVVESSLDKGRGPVATVLVQSGTLQQGDAIISGTEYGRVRAMLDENGRSIKQAGPAIPAQILGLSGTPAAGDDFVIVSDEKKAREVAELRRERSRAGRLASQKAVQLDQMFAQAGGGEITYVNLLVKADVQGSAEALKESLLKIQTDEVKVRLIATGVGGINESDANLAVTSGAAIIGFNVRADGPARRIIEAQGVDLRYYSIIYEVIDDVKKAVSGLLSPEIHENIIGLAEVRDVFRSSRLGAIAGCMALEGTIRKSSPIRVLRDNVVVYEGELESLRRFRDDVKEVKAGTECGIGVKNYNDVKAGDQIEVFERREVARQL